MTPTDIIEMHYELIDKATRFECKSHGYIKRKSGIFDCVDSVDFEYGHNEIRICGSSGSGCGCCTDDVHLDIPESIFVKDWDQIVLWMDAELVKIEKQDEINKIAHKKAKVDKANKRKKDIVIMEKKMLADLKDKYET